MPLQGDIFEEMSWHNSENDTVLSHLESSAEGLSSEVLEERQEQYGPNKLTPPKMRTCLRRFLPQFHNVLIDILLITAVITAALRHWIDRGVIMLVWV